MNVAAAIFRPTEPAAKIALLAERLAPGLSYAELSRLALVLGARLRAAGVASGDRVVLFFPNEVEAVVAVLGVLALGAVVVPLDIASNGERLGDALSAADPRLVLTSEDLARRLRAREPFGERTRVLRLERGELHLTVAGGDPEQPGAPTRETRSPFRVSPHDEDEILAALEQPVSVEDGADAVMIATSGSTGRPKLVRLSHGAVLANIRMHTASIRIDADEVAVQALPIAYSYGLVASLLGLLYSHATLVLAPAPAAGLGATLSRYGVTLLMTTPVTLRAALSSLEGSNLEGSNLEASDPPAPLALRKITIGGDRCPDELLARTRQQLPGVQAFITYGLSEAGPRVATLSPEDVAARPGSIGRPLTGVHARIVRDDGAACGVSEVGELTLQSPSLMSGYFRDGERTRAVLRDGWLFTGDMAYADGDGFLYLVGRRNREFKINGKKVAPELIEGHLARHPAVLGCLVRKSGAGADEFIEAVVHTPGPLSSELEGELKKLCREALGSRLTPRVFHRDDGPPPAVKMSARFEQSC